MLIESAAPAAYVVKRPDPLTLLVELRNVVVADAANVVQVDRRDAIAAVTLEQGPSVDGQALGLVRLTLVRPAEYVVHSTRNVIRLELQQPVRAAAAAATLRMVSQPAPSASLAPAQLEAEAPSATVLDRVRAIRTPSATTITLSGNGRLTPADVTESEERPRRLVLDFPNVSSKAPLQTMVDGSLVKRVRVAINSRQPLVTRVVMEVCRRSDLSRRARRRRRAVICRLSSNRPSRRVPCWWRRRLAMRGGLNRSRTSRSSRRLPTRSV